MVTAVLLSEVFPTAVRYTASAVTYKVSYAVFGGTAPFMATFLIAQTGNRMVPAVYLTAIALGAVIAAIMLPETAGRDFAQEDGNATTVNGTQKPEQGSEPSPPPEDGTVRDLTLKKR